MTDINVHNPVAPTLLTAGDAAQRLAGIAGRRVGFVDAMKPNAALFLKYIERLMTGEFPGIATETVRKNLTPNMAVAHELDRSVEGVVVAWGD